MSSQETIEAAIQDLTGAEKFFGRREIKELPKLLWEGEIPEKAIQGAYNNRLGLLVATNKRLMFIDKGMLSLKVEDFPYDKISSIQYSSGLALGSIEIYATGNKAKIKNVAKDQVRPFVEHVRSKTIKEPGNLPPSQIASDDIISQIEKLGQLKEQGILTEDEFLAKKKELLSRL